jgi:DNA polymerase-3 subunit epsilon
MQLHLTRPLIFFDIEATGLNTSHDRIVELSYIKVMPDGQELSETLRYNPEIPISLEASAVNGIYDADVADCIAFREDAERLSEVFSGCDIAGFNSNNFDIPMLVEEFLRAGVNYDITDVRFIDVQNIYHKMEQRTLSAAYKFYCNRNLEDAHTAMADTRATYEVLKSQLDRYPDTLSNDVEALAQFSTHRRRVDLAGRIVLNEQEVPIVNFGKYKGEPVVDVLRKNPGYLSWIMQGDFPQNTKQAFMRIKLQMQG